MRFVFINIFLSFFFLNKHISVHCGIFGENGKTKSHSRIIMVLDYLLPVLKYGLCTPSLPLSFMAAPRILLMTNKSIALIDRATCTTFSL